MGMSNPIDKDSSGSKKGKPDVAQDMLRDILRVIANKQATFPSEIAYKLNEDPKEIGYILRDLENSGVLERLHPAMKNNDVRLLNRRPEMHARGVVGLGEMKQRRWYGLNSELDWRLYDNNSEKWIDEKGGEVDKPGEVRNIVRFAEEETGL